MAKATTAASKRTAQTAAKAEEIQAASQTEAKPVDAAAPAGGTEVKAPDVQTATGAVDLAGTTDASAASEEAPRERAAAASTDRKDALEVGTQQEATAQPSVAEETDAGVVLVVTGPKKGRWRGGFHFSREPRSLTPADLGQPEEGAARLLAIVTDPTLTCAFHWPDGKVEPFGDDRIEQLRDVIDTLRSVDVADRDEAARALAARLGMQVDD